MKRQLIFLVLALALIASKLWGLIGIGWLIAGLVLLFLLWFPLRFACECQLNQQQVAVTCYILPFPSLRAKLFAFEKTILWWRDALTGLDKILDRKHVTKDGEADAAGDVKIAEENAILKAEKLLGDKLSPELISKALGALVIEKAEVSVVLGGSPMMAALAGGGIRTVIGWVFGIISYRVARFPDPKVNIALDPDGPLFTGNGLLQIRTDLAALLAVGIFFLKEMLRRKRNGGKRNRQLIADSHEQSPADGRC